MSTASERCESCGFVYDLASRDRAGAAIVQGTKRIAAILESAPPGVDERPTPATWSVLEYGCHVRDVLLVQRERVLLARRVDCPTLEPMGRDERVEHDGYAAQDPIAVARQLRDAAALLANVLTRLDDDAWNRTLMYSYPLPAERSVAWVAVHTEHEVVHHLADVRAQLPEV